MVDAMISRPGCAVWRVWAAQVPVNTPLARRARGHVRFTPSAAHRYRHVSTSGCRRAPDGQPTPRACDLMASTIYSLLRRERRVHRLSPEAGAVVGRQLLELQPEDLGDGGGRVRPRLVP